MRKRTIAWLFFIGILFAVVGGGVNVGGMATTMKGVILAGASVSAIGILLVLVSWIGALVATGRQGRWGWFVLVFLLSAIGELIYLIAGPTLG